MPRHGLLVNGDATRLTQVVTNVITNAAKYTEPRGRIHVSARLAGRNVELRVKDTGIGIAPELLPSVFEMFTQDRQALDRAQGGLGLGLTIARSLVALHDGTDRSAERRARQGQRVHHHAAGDRQRRRRRPTAPTPNLPVKATARTGRRVLVVDDNVDARPADRRRAPGGGPRDARRV